MIDSLVRAHAQERKDMVDRLMARDLTEVKQAQAMEDAPGPRAISKRSNEQRMAQEAKRMMEG